MDGFSVLYLLLHSSRSIAAFNGASACVNAACFPLITWPWTWLKSQNICVRSLLQPACPCLYVTVLCFKRGMCMHMFCKNVTIPRHVCNRFYNHYTLCPTCVWHSLMVEHKSSLWKIDAGALPYWSSQWRKTAAEPGSYRKNVNMGNMTLKTTLAALTLWLCVWMCVRTVCACVCGKK